MRKKNRTEYNKTRIMKKKKKKSKKRHYCLRYIHKYVRVS